MSAIPGHLTRADIKDVCALTPMQQGMLHHVLLVPDDDAYHEQLLALFEGELDLPRLAAAWQAVINRHDALRGLFLHRQVSRPAQLIPHRQDILIQRWTDAPAEASQPSGAARRAARAHPAAVEAMLAADLARPFRPDREHAMRWMLWSDGSQRHWLLWSFHHLLIDGWSIGLVLDEVRSAYRRLGQGEAPFAEPAPPYQRYQRWLAGQDREAALRYWQDTLHGCEASALTGAPATVSSTGGPLLARLAMPAARVTALGALAAKHRATLAQLLCAVWGLVCGRFQGRRDLPIGTVLAGRPAAVEGSDRMAGLFIATVPVRVAWEESEGFGSLLEQVRTAMLAANAHAHLPLADIQACASLAVGQSGQSGPSGHAGGALFDSLLLVQNLPHGDALGPLEAGLSLTDIDFRERTPFPLELSATIDTDGLVLTGKGDPARLDQARLDALLAGIDHCLTAILDTPDLPLAQLSSIGAAHRATLSRPPNDARDVNRQPDRQACGQASAGDSGVASPSSPRIDAILRAFASVVPAHRFAPHDDFFNAGGHSLRAMQAIGLINRALGTDWRLADLYRARTAAALAALPDHPAGEHDDTPPPIAPAPALPDHPLSSAQLAIWALAQQAPDHSGYNVPGAYRVRGTFEPQAFFAAWETVAARHEALRTVFPAPDGEPRQRVLPALAAETIEEDWRGRSPAEIQARVDALCARPFDLANGPLVRLAWLRIDDAASDTTTGRAGDADPAPTGLLLLVLHHLVTDGWSDQLLARDLAEAYAAQCEHRAPQLGPAPACRYRDFAHWQRSLLAGSLARRWREAWRERLLQPEPAPLLQLPADGPRGRRLERPGARLAFSPGDPVSRRWLAATGNRLRAPALAAAVAVLLHLESGQNDLVIGLPVAGRDRAELQDQVGLHLNMLPLRLRPSAALTLAGMLEQADAVYADALSRADYPFAELIASLGLSAAPGRHPVFDVMLLVHQHPMPVPRFGEAQVEPAPCAPPAARFDLDFELWAEDDRVHGFIDYDASLFRPASAQRLAERLAAVLAACADSPSLTLDALRARLTGRSSSGERQAFLARSLAIDEEF